ncbi:MAG TPA: hypothetical protein VLF59_01645 [Candidatus Saccharimonadales bacterium]|nr:hypothetical protein [Candidatus Saccharimonadales bacterium]
MRILHQKVRTFESYTPAQRRYFEVTENSSKRSSQGALLCRAVGRSALVVAHNAYTMQGLVGCFQNIRVPDQNDLAVGLVAGEGSAAFDRSLRRIGGLGPSRETSIWLGGASVYDEADHYVRGGFSERRYIRSRMDTLGPLADMAMEWTQEAHEAVHIQLAPETGTLYVEELRLPGHFLEQTVAAEEV